MIMIYVGCALFGFLAGLFAFKVKSRWCPVCGAMTVRSASQPAPTRADRVAAAPARSGRAWPERDRVGR